MTGAMKEIKVHPSHQLEGGFPDRVMVPADDRLEIHPSHELYTGKPYFHVGEEVMFLGRRARVEEIRNVGSSGQTIFQYRLVTDEVQGTSQDRQNGLLTTDGELQSRTTNWITIDGFSKLEK